MEKSYLIVGFTDKTKMADFEKEYKRKCNAMKKIDKMKVSGLYQCIVLREEITYKDCGVEVSRPILKIEEGNIWRRRKI